MAFASKLSDSARNAQEQFGIPKEKPKNWEKDLDDLCSKGRAGTLTPEEKAAFLEACPITWMKIHLGHIKKERSGRNEWAIELDRLCVKARANELAVEESNVFLATCPYFYMCQHLCLEAGLPSKSVAISYKITATTPQPKPQSKPVTLGEMTKYDSMPAPLTNKQADRLENQFVVFDESVDDGRPKKKTKKKRSGAKASNAEAAPAQ